MLYLLKLFFQNNFNLEKRWYFFLGKIDVLRKKIDEIDSNILKLLNKRAKIALDVGHEKTKTGKTNFHVPHREREIFHRLGKINTGPFPNKAIFSVFREILSATLSLEKPLTIAYLGPQATFSHIAGLKEFGESAHYCTQKSIEDVFKTVEKNFANYGIVPAENSIEGTVNSTLDMLIQTDLKITAEVLLRVSHHLLSLERDTNNIKKIYSHPQPVAQCRSWLRENLPGIKIQEVSSTARASELAAQHPSSAAIAGEEASKMYKLRTLAKGIEDSTSNVTRFMVIGNEITKKCAKNKTSLLFAVKDKPGALFNVLNHFAKYNINLTKIESRPLKNKKWEYLFFADIEGFYKDNKIKNAIIEIEKSSLFFKLLGSYPVGREV